MSSSKIARTVGHPLYVHVSRHPSGPIATLCAVIGAGLGVSIGRVTWRWS